MSGTAKVRVKTFFRLRPGLLAALALLLSACGGFAAPSNSGLTPYVVVVTPTPQPATATAIVEATRQAIQTLTPAALTPTAPSTTTPAIVPGVNAAPTATSAPKPTASLAVADNKYTVQAGDTLLGVAIRLGVDYDELVDLNDITDPNSIRIGQVLKLPPRKPPAPTPTK